MDLSLKRSANNFGKGNFVFVMLLGLVAFAVFAGAVTWIGSDIDYVINEDTTYYHNLSANITGFDSNITFIIDTQPINWTNATGTFQVNASDVSGWISILNSINGNLSLNATMDNQTGYFVIPIQANNISGDDAITDFEFQINATNDAPTFDSTQTVYNWTEEVNASYTINTSDEELHYPINYTLVPISCTHASWSGRNEDENCSIFNVTETSNTSAVFNISPVHNDVGTYIFNLSITDYSTVCPHAYCVNSTYNVNRTFSKKVTFNILSTLAINTTNCDGSVLTEGVEFTCEINITTKVSSENVDISSNAFFRNLGTQPINTSFFKSNETVTSNNFTESINISFTPAKGDVGNLTINFTADPVSGSAVTNQIYIFVNWTESNVSLGSISDLTIYENQTLYVAGTDEDLLIRDSTVKDEELTFASNVSWVSVSWNTSTGSGDNFINATLNIDFDNISASGDKNHSVLINVTDAVGNVDSTVFTIEVLNDTAASWNSSKSFVNVTSEGANVYINLTNGWVNDSENDILNFSFTNTSEFENFNLTISGIINFTSSDVDVGYHNITINAYDGKLNSFQEFNFTINNVADVPSINDLYRESNFTTITNASSISGAEDVQVNFTLIIDDEDFLIPSGQEASFYNESLTVTTTATNDDGLPGNLFNFTFEDAGPFAESVTYNATFTPSNSQADNYTIFINITDNNGNMTSRTFYFNISSSPDAPILGSISNQTKTISELFYLDIDATDEEDDLAGKLLNYTVNNLTVGGDFLTINITTGVINVSLNSSLAGIWEFNVTVNDSEGGEDFQVFRLTIYGNATLISPTAGVTFNLVENFTSVLNFTLNHSVGDNLTYEFYIDSISCTFANSSNCNYTNLTLREINNSFGNATSYNWSLIPNFTDETYGNLKNITISVYPNSTLLNSTQRNSLKTNFTFKLNISHLNHIPEKLPSSLSLTSGYGSSSPISIDFTEIIIDYDYLDSYYLQNLTFYVRNPTLGSNSELYAEGSSSANQLPWNGTVEGSSLQIYALKALSEFIEIEVNDSFGSATSDSIEITFTEPTTTTTTTPSSGSSSTTLKHFSLNLIIPEDLIISDNNFITVPFKIQNNGQVDLSGISISSFVRFNNEFTDDVTITLEEDYIDLLEQEESKNYTLRINSNTQRAGKYKATIYANVTSPKFSDFADFFIVLEKANESAAEQLLIFTEEFLKENPVCLELTELFREAERLYSLGEFSDSILVSREVIEACEERIARGNQVRYPISGFVESNLYYISFATLTMLLIGFVFYVYKRVRFNKSKLEEYM